VERVRPICDAIDQQVRGLLVELVPASPGGDTRPAGAGGSAGPGTGRAVPAARVIRQPA